MAKPILFYELPTSSRRYFTNVLGEFDNYIIIGGLLYDIDTLRLVTDKLVTLENVPSDYTAFGISVFSDKYTLGSQWYSASYNLLSSITFQPNYELCQNEMFTAVGHSNNIYQLTGTKLWTEYSKSNINKFFVTSVAGSAGTYNYEFLVRTRDNIISSYTNTDPASVLTNYSTNLLVNLHGTGFQFIGKNTSGNLYYFTTQYYSATMRVSYYDINTRTLTHLTTQSMSYRPTNYGLVPTQIYYDDVNNSVIRFYYVGLSSATALQPVLVIVDKDNKTVTYTNCTITGSYSVNYTITNCATCHFTPFLSRINNDYYLSVYFSSYDDHGSDNNSRIITFKIDKSNPSSLTFISQINLTGRLKDYISLNYPYNTDIVIPSNVGCHRLTFNGSNWTKTDLTTVGTNGLLFDSRKRLWILGYNNAVWMYKPLQNLTIDIKFDRQIYRYNGSDINANVIINALDNNGTRQLVNGTLSILSDNAVFQDGSKQTVVTTDLNNDTVVPIIIRGTGTVDIKFDRVL